MTYPWTLKDWKWSDEAEAAALTLECPRCKATQGLPCRITTSYRKTHDARRVKAALIRAMLIKHDAMRKKMKRMAGDLMAIEDAVSDMDR